MLSGVPDSIRMLDMVYAHPYSLRDSLYNLSCYPHVTIITAICSMENKQWSGQYGMGELDAGWGMRQEM